MSIAIFFGGLVLGFLIGWVFMVLLTMATIRNRKSQFPDPSTG